MGMQTAGTVSHCFTVEVGWRDPGGGSRSCQRWRKYSLEGKIERLGLLNTQKRELKGKHTTGWEYIFSNSKEKVLFSRSMEDRRGNSACCWFGQGMRRDTLASSRDISARPWEDQRSLCEYIGSRRPAQEPDAAAFHSGARSRAGWKGRCIL